MKSHIALDYRGFFFCGCIGVRRLIRLAIRVLIVRVFIIVAVLLRVLKEKIKKTHDTDAEGV